MQGQAANGGPAVPPWSVPGPARPWTPGPGGGEALERGAPAFPPVLGQAQPDPGAHLGLRALKSSCRAAAGASRAGTRPGRAIAALLPPLRFSASVPPVPSGLSANRGHQTQLGDRSPASAPQLWWGTAPAGQPRAGRSEGLETGQHRLPPPQIPCVPAAADFVSWNQTYILCLCSGSLQSAASSEGKPNQTKPRLCFEKLTGSPRVRALAGKPCAALTCVVHPSSACGLKGGCILTRVLTDKIKAAGGWFHPFN